MCDNDRTPNEVVDNPIEAVSENKTEEAWGSTPVEEAENSLEEITNCATDASDNERDEAFVGEPEEEDRKAQEETTESATEEASDIDLEEPDVSTTMDIAKSAPKEVDRNIHEENVQPEILTYPASKTPIENFYEKLNTIQANLFDIIEKTVSLEKLFESRISRTEHEEKIIDRMHDELKKYKDDLYAQLVRPILLEIIAVRDSISRTAKINRTKPIEEQCIDIDTFESYKQEIQEILLNNNIEIYNNETNSNFIPNFQRPIKRVATPDQLLHGKVAESLSDGYRYEGKIVSPEKVAVYYYDRVNANSNNKVED